MKRSKGRPTSAIVNLTKPLFFFGGLQFPFLQYQISLPSLSNENLKKKKKIMYSSKKMLVNFLKNLFGNEPVNNQKITNAKRVLVTVFLPLQKSQKIVFSIFLCEL